MKNPQFRPVLVLAILFLAAAGAIVIWGLHTDATMGTAVPVAANPIVPAVPVTNVSGDSVLWPTMRVLGVTLAGIFLIVLYFLPALNAQQRHHRERKPILILNIFLGWTFLGWIAAFVWSFTSQVEAAPPPGQA